MEKYYKDNYSRLTVKWLEEAVKKGTFKGIVVNKGKSNREDGERGTFYYGKDFLLYTPTPEELAEWGETATLTKDNPNKVEVDDKDVNLRLECLKLAVTHTETNVRGCAELFYNWITQKP